MQLIYDPADEDFIEQMMRIPGFPEGEEVPVKKMLFESNAIFSLPEVLRSTGAVMDQPLLVVMDTTLMRRGEEDLKALVLKVLREGGWQVETLILQPDETGQVHTDMHHIEEVKARLRPGMSVLSVGSGVVTDVTKHGSYLYQKACGCHIPFTVFQTANSVSAYMSNMAPVLQEGVKRTLTSRYPEALVADLETLRDAPYDMTVAGVGDLLAVYVSFPDWYLAYRLGMEKVYTDLSQSLLGPMDEIFLEQAENIRTGSLEGHAILAKLIALGGFAVSVLHTTTPLSGYEHVFSHVLDLQGEQAHRMLAPHGSQVALASVIATDMYEHFLREFDPGQVEIEDCYPPEEELHQHLLSEFAKVDPSGKAGNECWKDYNIKLEAWKAHQDDFRRVLKDWPEICGRLQSLVRPPEKLLEIMKSISGPQNFHELVPPIADEDVRFAYFNAPLLRRRLTIGDLFIFLNWDREKLWQQVWSRFE